MIALFYFSQVVGSCISKQNCNRFAEKLHHSRTTDTGGHDLIEFHRRTRSVFHQAKSVIEQGSESNICPVLILVLYPTLNKSL